MKKHLKILVVLIAVFLFGNSSLAQKSGSRKPPKKAALTVLGDSHTEMNFLGTVEGRTYKNKFFGLKLILPEVWLIQEKQVNDAVKQVGSEMVKGKTSQMQKAYDNATQRLTILLTVSKDILGMENNPTLIFSAEKTPPLLQIRNGQDYLRLNIQSFKKLKLPADFRYSETISAETFGNETFHYIQVDRATYSQRFYAIHRRGYSLFFTLSYASNEDLETMKKVIRDSDFSWKK